MKYHNLFIYLWLILAAIAVSSCSYYKRVENVRDNGTDEDEKLLLKQIYQSFDQESYLVLRHNDELWHLSNVALSEDRKTVLANREKVSKNHYDVFKKIQSTQLKTYLPKEKPYIHQTHLFVQNYDFNEESNKVSIPIDNVLKFEIYKYDKTVSGIVIVTSIVIGVPLAGIALLAIICNCPYIYSEDGDQLIFEGNLFTGSIYPSLERTDYIPILNNSSNSGTFNIAVANENEEILNINQLGLLSIKHEIGIKVLIDQAGIPHTISNPIPPIQATSFKRYNHTEDLQKADNLEYDFGSPEINSNTTLSELDLVFNNSSNAEIGKLVLRVKNNNWGGFIYDEVSNMLGKRFEWYHKKQEHKSSREMKELMRKEGMAMSVSIFQDGTWQPIDIIWPTGSKVYREVVIPVDLRNMKDDNIVFKLEGGFKFWDIDQATIDYSEDSTVEIYESFAEANDVEKEHEIINKLRYDDEHYMNEILPGEKIDLEFKVQNQDIEGTYSYFLKGKGYYSLEKEYQNRMRIAELLRFKNEGGFSYYSFKRFNEIAESLVIN